MNDSFRIELSPEHRLAICRPVGTLDAEVARQLLIFVLALEDVHPEPFDRLLDVTGIEEIRLSAQDIYEYSKARLLAAAGRPPFRMAIVAPDPLANGTARIYETLM